MGRVRAALLKRVLVGLGSWLTKPERSRLIAQNCDDYRLLGGIGNSRVHLIPGSGVDLKRFPRSALSRSDEFRVLLAARMIREKGIVEFVRAIEILRLEGLPIFGYLAGEPDEGNPNSMNASEIESLTAGSGVTWLGHRDDMFDLIVNSDVVCLPTYYGEGIPRVLLEAGGVGRTVITCDVPGPRDLVRHGVDGLLVDPRDPYGLADAIRKLGANRQMLLRMGTSLHNRVRDNFANSIVLNEYLKLYELGDLQN